MKNKKADLLNLWNNISMRDDERSFESLFYLLNEPLIRFCNIYVHQKEAAEEIVSDVFCKCWMKRKELTEIQNLEAYLFVAVKNQSLNYNKKSSNILLTEIDETDELKFADLFNPQDELEKKELLFLLDEAIATLPLQCRLIFILVKEDELSYKEAAKILNISPATVKTQLYRAVKKLDTALSAHLSRASNPKRRQMVLKIIVLCYFIKIIFTACEPFC
ncbi:MAG: RNA polymerase sigma-70 factor [Bacteroidota bacterium]|nr:RNA polymerase sigma-70 factor [Bacteroidota bacterium]